MLLQHALSTCRDVVTLTMLLSASETARRARNTIHMMMMIWCRKPHRWPLSWKDATKLLPITSQNAHHSTVKLSGTYVINLSLQSPPHLILVATLPMKYLLPFWLTLAALLVFSTTLYISHKTVDKSERLWWSFLKISNVNSIFNATGHRTLPPTQKSVAWRTHTPSSRTGRNPIPHKNTSTQCIAPTQDSGTVC